MAYAPTGLSIEVKALTAAIAGLIGSFCLGITTAKAIYTIPLATIYMFWGMRLPGHPDGGIPAKPDQYIASFLGIVFLLVACMALFGIGRLIRFAKMRKTNGL